MIRLSSGFSEIIHLDKELQGCELAISDKAKCILCKRIITQGTPRLWIFGELKQPPPDEGIVKIKRFICSACATAIIEYKEKYYRQEIKRGEKAKEKMLKHNIIKNCYFNYLRDENILKKIRNDEIIRELEEGDQDIYNK